MSHWRTQSLAAAVLTIVVAAVALSRAQFNNPPKDRIIGVSPETYNVTIRIGRYSFSFPRNYIYGGVGGPRLALDISSGGGITTQTAPLYDRWGGGTNHAPSLIEVELTQGSTEAGTANWRRELAAQEPIDRICGLPAYQFAGSGRELIVEKPRLTSVFCNGYVPICTMNFDFRDGVGVRVTLAEAQLCQWPYIQSFVDKMLVLHLENT